MDDLYRVSGFTRATTFQDGRSWREGSSYLPAAELAQRRALPLAGEAYRAASDNRAYEGRAGARALDRQTWEDPAWGQF